MRVNFIGGAILALVVLALVGAYGTLFTVHQTHQAIVVRLGNPVHVITAGTFLNNPLVPPARRASLQSQWEDLQRRLLALSSRATQSMAPRSGHFVQRDDPRIVINAIAAMIARVRRASATLG